MYLLSIFYVVGIEQMTVDTKINEKKHRFHGAFLFSAKGI